MKNGFHANLLKNTMGYIYCFSNKSMLGIYKIGMTERDPIERLKEANKTDTWKPPMPYVIEFAKRVDDPKTKEGGIHRIFEDLGFRPNVKREFFNVPLETAREIFKLIDGEWWEETKVDQKEFEELDTHYTLAPKRDMHFLKDGQTIRHKVWVQSKAQHAVKYATYDEAKDVIVEESGRQHDSINKFALEHIREYNPSRIQLIGGRMDCEAFVDKKWVSVLDLRLKMEQSKAV
jgi:hypothetical protein